MRDQQQNYFIYLGRGQAFEGLWLGWDRPEPQIRFTDKYVMLLRKYLTNQKIAIECDHNDRVISVNTPYAEFIIFYRGRDAYYVMRHSDIYIASWLQGKKNWTFENCKYDVFNTVGREKNEDLIDQGSISIDTLLSNEIKEFDKFSKKNLKQKRKKLEQKLKNIMSDIDRLENFTKLRSILNTGEVDKSLVGDRFVHCGIKVRYGSNESIFKKRSLVFDKIKRIETAMAVQAKRLEKTKERIESIKPDNMLVNVIKPIEYKANKKLIDESNTSSSAGYKINVYLGYEVAVGLNATGNDNLRKQYSKKDDLWVHAEKGVSAHAIIKLKDLTKLNEALRMAASLIAPNDTELSIIYTKVKNLKGVKGSAGLVIYKNEKHLKVIF